jgi:DivIVA domain-containing protein
MELTPQSVRSTTFSTARKGYDQDEVEAFKEQAAAAIEAAQNQSAAMEARARAAVARLQELSAADAGSAPSVETAPPAGPSPADAEIISRTLMLAQRTADATVAGAEQEAAQLRASAEAESTALLENARVMAGRLLDEARVEARRSLEDERMSAENEVQALMARRDFLVGDVEQLELYVGSQRERLRDAAVQLLDMVDRVPGGLAEMRRPLLSAAGEGTASPASHEPEEIVTVDDIEPISTDDRVASVDDDTDEVPTVVVATGDGDSGR